MRAVRVLAFLGALALLVALATAQEPETTEPEKPDVAPLLAACQTQVRARRLFLPRPADSYFKISTVVFRRRPRALEAADGADRARPRPARASRATDGSAPRASRGVLTASDPPPPPPSTSRFRLQLADMTSKFQSNQAIVDKYHEMGERLTAAVTEKLDMKQEKVALKEEVAKLEEEVAKLLNRPEPGALDLCAKLATILWTSAKASAPGFVTDLADGVAEVAGPAYAKVAAVAGPAAKKTEILLRRAWRVAAPAMAAAAARASPPKPRASARAPRRRRRSTTPKPPRTPPTPRRFPSPRPARATRRRRSRRRARAPRARSTRRRARTLEKASTIDALRPHATETAARAVVALALAAPALLILWALVGAVMRRGRISVKKSVAASSVPLRTPSPEAKKAPFAATGRTTRSSREIRSPNGDVVKFA